MFENGAFWASKLLFEAHDYVTMAVKLTIPIQENNSIGKWPRIAANFKLISVRQLIHSTYRPNRAMNEETENVSDRELFSEFFENPIHPLQIQWHPPFVDENSPMFYLQLNGDAALR